VSKDLVKSFIGNNLPGFEIYPVPGDGLKMFFMDQTSSLITLW